MTEIGVLLDCRMSPEEQERPDRYYDEAWEFAQEAERLGFHSVNLSEHHGECDGYGAGLLVSLGHLAARTRRVRIGTAILQLPLHNPVAIAQELAALDQQSHGRLDLGLGMVGPGFQHEFAMLGLDAADRVERFDEGMHILQRAWAEDEPFDFAGRHYQLRGVRVRPRPMQQVPMWIAAPRGSYGMHRAAGQGLGVGGLGGFFAGLTGGQQWTEWLTSWWEVCDQWGIHREERRRHSWGTVFVDEDPERAWLRYRQTFYDTVVYKHDDGRYPYRGLLPYSIPTVPEEISGWDNVFLTRDQLRLEIANTYSKGAPHELLIKAKLPGMTWDYAAAGLRAVAGLFTTPGHIELDQC